MPGLPKLFPGSQDVLPANYNRLYVNVGDSADADLRAIKDHITAKYRLCVMDTRLLRQVEADVYEYLWKYLGYQGPIGVRAVARDKELQLSVCVTNK